MSPMQYEHSFAEIAAELAGRAYCKIDLLAYCEMPPGWLGWQDWFAAAMAGIW